MINEKIERGQRRLARLARKLEEVQEEHLAAIEALEKRAIEINQELQFIERCALSIADRQQAGQGAVEVPVA